MIIAEKTLFTSADLALMPDDNNCYEIIEGELFVSRSPSYEHQYTCGCLIHFLMGWSRQHGLGVVLNAPGIIFADDDDVVPDVVWMSRERVLRSADKAGHLHEAPELAIEVLSPGKENERRDREAKRDLYARRGVQEYWIVDWIQHQIEIYRREQGLLIQVATLYHDDQLQSPLLPGFSCQVSELFF
ncbi:MAG TPA: Uma2 family endonuclease [Blastocatellia bacterium]|nr:Uma2 family endonuclease [Blastocatellia bacterium]